MMKHIQILLLEESHFRSHQSNLQILSFLYHMMEIYVPTSKFPLNSGCCGFKMENVTGTRLQNSRNPFFSVIKN